MLSMRLEETQKSCHFLRLDSGGQMKRKVALTNQNRFCAKPSLDQSSCLDFLPDFVLVNNQQALQLHIPL